MPASRKCRPRANNDVPASQASVPAAASSDHDPIRILQQRWEAFKKCGRSIDSNAVAQMNEYRVLAEEIEAAKTSADALVDKVNAIAPADCTTVPAPVADAKDALPSTVDELYSMYNELLYTMNARTANDATTLLALEAALVDYHQLSAISSALYRVLDTAIVKPPVE